MKGRCQLEGLDTRATLGPHLRFRVWGTGSRVSGFQGLVFRIEGPRSQSSSLTSRTFVELVPRKVPLNVEIFWEGQNCQSVPGNGVPPPGHRRAR